MWLAKTADRSELLILLQLISMQHSVERWRQLLDAFLLGVLDDTLGISGC